jgi:hypothetical protein
MNDCRDCEFAVYCYSEPGNWMFRTREEMARIEAQISSCPAYSQVQARQAERAAGGCCARRPSATA